MNKKTKYTNEPLGRLKVIPDFLPQAEELVIRGRKGGKPVEVGNVSKHGFWLLVGGRELFLPFENFPWLKDVPIGQLLNVKLLRSHHLYWPDLDVDLSLESIERPERFPLVSRARPNQPPQLRARARPTASASQRTRRTHRG